MHAKVSGPSDAPTVILLHGFPGFHRDWRTQVPALNAANVRTIALDMRGYAQSEKPKGIENYKMELLVDDVRAAITQLCPSGYARAVVGHDWGGAVAWSFALANETSGLFERLAVLNLPHPLRFQQALQSDPSQLLKSWYIGAFQIPGVAEAALTAQDSLILRRLYTTEPRPPYTSDEVERYVKAFNTPGAAEATVNYYRAALQLGGFFSGFTESAYSVIDKPTLVLWGEDDAYLTTNMADPPTRLVPNCTVVKIPDATHWVMIFKCIHITSFSCFLNECRERVCDTALSHGRVAAFSKPSVVPRHRTWPEPCNGIVEHVTRRSFHSTC